MAEVTLSSKHQIVVPLEARQALGARPGDKLLVVTRGETVIPLRKPKRCSSAIRGIGAGVYPPGYVLGERESWSARSVCAASSPATGESFLRPVVDLSGASPD
jgi:AbrB family looped-hinge helix DNA binding protein